MIQWKTRLIFLCLSQLPNCKHIQVGNNKILLKTKGAY
ncbi:hypothetical protein F383_13322 [Gossypium arboreum]|uniref:Uncharacterized protein n=1 Tax=Gossypium arboreum TaxID=29729 RepID=A0A0B0MFA9_GOSAR|nr:hypothetical protein F383_13322 [Gossypium arboreum]